MAARYGVGKDTVARIWQARRIRPWKVETFKLSTDPSFESMTHDYKRNGTLDLFAALNVGSGEVLHDTRRSHTGRDWLAHKKRRRWHLHFTPTSSSWLNLVECWFSVLSRKALTIASFTSVAELETRIDCCVSH